MKPGIPGQDGEVHNSQGTMGLMFATDQFTALRAVKCALVILLTVTAVGCAVSEVKEPKPADALDVTLAPLLGKPTWSQELPGLITEVQMAPNGDVVLSTRPENGRGVHAIFRYAKTGKLRWKARFKNLVRMLTLSLDGERVLYNAYQDELGVLDARGKPLWKRQALCRPYALPENRVLCYQDDDDQPGLAFTVWSADGEKIGTKEAKADAVVIAFPPEHAQVALGYAGGKIELLDTVSRVTLWEKTVEGEVVDLSLSENSERLAVLYTDLKKQKKLTVFNREGKSLGDFSFNFAAEQLVFAPGARVLLAADPGGASPRFQALNVEAQPTSLWERESRRPAEYSVGARTYALGWLAYLGVEGLPGKLTREAEVAALNASPAGEAQWRARIPVPAGGYLYAFDGHATATGGYLAIATDLGRIVWFKVP